MEFLLVGATHDMSGISRRFFDGEGDRLFRERVLPRLSDEVILFTEGSWMDVPLRPGCSAYESKRSEFVPGADTRGVNPTILGSDIRCKRYVTAPARLRFMKDAMRFTEWCVAHVVVDDVPDSLAQMIDWYQSKPGFSFNQKPERAMRDLARSIMIDNRDMHDALIKRMRNATIHGSQRMLIAGLAHALELHVSTGWPIETLCDVSLASPTDRQNL